MAAYAEMLLKQERCEEALTLAKRGVQLVPGSTEAWIQLSKALFTLTPPHCNPNPTAL